MWLIAIDPSRAGGTAEAAEPQMLPYIDVLYVQLLYFY